MNIWNIEGIWWISWFSGVFGDKTIYKLINNYKNFTNSRQLELKSDSCLLVEAAWWLVVAAASGGADAGLVVVRGRKGAGKLVMRKKMDVVTSGCVMAFVAVVPQTCGRRREIVILEYW